MKLLLLSLNKNLYSIKRLAQEARPYFDSLTKAHWRDLTFSFTPKGFRAKVNGQDLSSYSHLITRIAKKYYLQRYLLISQAQKLGLRTLNQELILNMPTYNKLFQYSLLAQAQIPLIPSHQILNQKNLKNLGLDYPLIVKRITGEQAKQVHKANTQKEAIKYLKQHRFRKCLIQNFTPTGEDTRLYVIGRKVVASYKRKALKGFKTVPKGQSLVYQPSELEQRLALKAAKALKGECVGVDLIYFQNKPYILEVNLDAGFKTLEKISKVNIAKEIIKQVLKSD